MNPIFSIPNDDPRVTAGILSLQRCGAPAVVTQRVEIAANVGYECFVTTFWAPNVKPYAIGYDERQLGEHDGYECISGDLAYPIYRRISLNEMRTYGLVTQSPNVLSISPAAQPMPAPVDAGQAPGLEKVAA